MWYLLQIVSQFLGMSWPNVNIVFLMSIPDVKFEKVSGTEEWEATT